MMPLRRSDKSQKTYNIFVTKSGTFHYQLCITLNHNDKGSLYFYKSTKLLHGNYSENESLIFNHILLTGTLFSLTACLIFLLQMGILSNALLSTSKCYHKKNQQKRLFYSIIQTELISSRLHYRALLSNFI